jgi:hypothetical protein
MNYDIVTDFEKLKIDIFSKREITTTELLKLKDFFYFFEIHTIMCNKFIDKFIELSNEKISIEKVSDKCLLYKVNDEKVLYFHLNYYKNYNDNYGIKMYWCGTNYTEYDDAYFRNNRLDMKNMEEAIKFYKDCPFFEKKIINYINIELGNYRINNIDIINEKSEILSAWFVNAVSILEK